MGDNFLPHLGPVVPIEHCLNITAYLITVAAYVRLFMTTVYLVMAGSSFQQDNACHTIK